MMNAVNVSNSKAIQEQIKPSLEVFGLSFSYEHEPVLEQVSFTTTPGQLIGIIGPNGAGKSTLIKAIVGAITPDAGSIRVMGETGREALRRLTYVPQRGSVEWDFPITARDVVAQGCYGRLGLWGRMRGEERRVVDEALERVALSELADRQINALSGGQQQRVFLARALAQQGDVYLLDEPFVGVDAATESAIIEVLRTLRDAGRTLLVVHHDLGTARDYFDAILLLNRRVIASGPTREVFTAPLLQSAYGGRLTLLNDDAQTALIV